MLELLCFLRFCWQGHLYSHVRYDVIQAFSFVLVELEPVILLPILFSTECIPSLCLGPGFDVYCSSTVRYGCSIVLRLSKYHWHLHLYQNNFVLQNTDTLRIDLYLMFVYKYCYVTLKMWAFVTTRYLWNLGGYKMYTMWKLWSPFILSL